MATTATATTTASSQKFNNDNEILHLVVRCAGLKINTKVVQAKSSLLSNIYSKVAGGIAVKHEKVCIKMSQSEPFKPNDRPNSYNYAHAYSSEIFENIHHPCPSLVANIRCPSALDCQLRLGVYYSSSVTSGKDILLASTAFSKRELIRGISLDKSGCFTSELVSDYCPGSKAYVEIVEPLRCPLGDGLSPTVSQINHDQNDAEENHINKAGRFLITGNISEVNPIRRKYVFYNEEDCLSPQVEAEEVVWEPKFVAKISSYFVDEFATRLVRSINAWNLRHELERKRQGLFHTDEEALRCGWHRVRITVRAIRIGFCKAQKQREHIRKLVEAEERQQKLLQQHLKSNYGADAHHNHVLHNVYSIVLPVGPVGIQNSDGSGVGSIGLSLLPQNTTASNSLVSGAVPSRSLSSVGEEKRNRTQSADILGASENLIRVHENLFTVGKRVDETAPSTYVDIFIEDREQLFLRQVGRTNTEYYQYHPIYGTNVHSSHCKKPKLSPSYAVNAAIEQSEVKYRCHMYETTDRDSVYESYIIPRNRSASFQAGLEPGVSSNSFDIPLPAGDRLHVSESSYNSYSMLPPPTSPEIGRNVSTSSRRDSTESRASARPPTRPTTSGNTSKTHVHRGPASIVVSGSEYCFSQYLPNCQHSTVMLGFMLEDLGGNPSADKRIGLAKIQLEEGMSFCDWVPVKVEDTYIPGKVSSRQSSNDRPATEANSSSPMDNLSDRPDFDDIEVMVEISVLSPTAECTRRAPESMSDSYLFERTITGIPIPLTLSADESNLAEGINTIVNESGLRDDTLGQSFCTNEVLHGQTSIALKNFDCLSYAALDHDYRCAISSAYNWMWQIGFNGTDPLAIAPEFSNISSGHGDLTTNTEAHIAAGRVSFVEQLVNSEFAKEPFNSLNNLPDSDDEEFYSHEDHRTSTLRAPFDLLNEVDQLENRHDSFDEYCDRDFESLSYMVENGRNTLFMDSKQYLSNFSFSYKPTKQLEEASNVQVTSKRQLPVEGTDDLLFVDELVPDSVNKVSALQLPPGEDQTSPSQCANSEESFMEANNCSAINNMMQGYSLIEVMGGANNVHANLADCSQGASVTSHVAPGHENTNCESRYLVQQRVDCPYPLQWITEHLNDLEELVMEMRSLLSEMNVLINKGVTFRPSTLKKEIYYQAIPINLHYQLLSVKAHSSNKPFTDVVHSLTCGAMSPHYLGHKNGGLFFQEMELVVKREEIERLKASYLCLTEEAKMKGLQLDERYGIGAEAFTVLSSLRSIVTAFEKSCLQLGRRRVYAIAQAVSIAVNCVLLKLALVREGTIPFQVAERWVQDGFLIVFEGLLSVVGHERSMLEDTMSAVDALRSYQVRILSNEFLMNRRHGRCAGSGLNNEANENKYDNQDKTSDHTFQKIDGVEVEMSGREVVIYLSEELLSQLPESYRLQAQSRSSFGTVLHLVPVLFTQGIDIQQTMATTFGGSSRHHIKSADLQLYVNTRAMNILNAFCKRTQAVNALYNFDHTTVLSSNRNQAEIKDSTTISEEDWTKSSVDGTKRSQSKVKEKSDRRRSSGMFLPEIHDVHPLLHHLHENIATASIKAKNVELLTEVERICVLLEGCRVTFCKSGKDRTGMAVTLEQSRQLGERFCCGLSTARLMKDANLFRLHGTRLLIAEKNIGRRVYSINKLQAQFLPPLYRPPPQTCEDLMKKDNS